MPSKALKVATFGEFNPGKVEYFASDSVPRGWLKCNGQAVSRALYSDLFAKIGTTYGAGNGSTTFNNSPISAGTTTGPETTGNVRGPVTDGISGTPRTAEETRPRNVAMLACIKF